MKKLLTVLFVSASIIACTKSNDEGPWPTKQYEGTYYVLDTDLYHEPTDTTRQVWQYRKVPRTRYIKVTAVTRDLLQFDTLISDGTKLSLTFTGNGSQFSFNSLESSSFYMRGTGVFTGNTFTYNWTYTTPGQGWVGSSGRGTKI